MRKETQLCLRSITQLQRRLKELQKTWPAAPDVNAINGPVPPNVINLCRDIFHKHEVELTGHATIPEPKAA